MTTKEEIRYLGPYPFRERWRCQIVNGTQRIWLSPEATAERAEAVAERFLAELTARQPVTVSQALDGYREYMVTVRGNKVRSADTTVYRLRRFFTDQRLAVSALTQRRCAGYYEAITKRQRPDTHRNTLSEARTFCNWLIKQRYLRTNPIDGIEPIGRRRKGKPQLHIDEAKRWLHNAEEQASKGEQGAVAAMMTLLLGLRASEVVERQVRDLDNDGRLLWIPHSKTEAGRRIVKVPEQLRPHLLRIARGKLPTAYLFTGKTGGPPERAWPRKWVKRLCSLARVPLVCAHSMRGLHATLAIEAGASPDLVARTLGHEHASVTLGNYATPGSAQSAQQVRTLRLLTGES